MRLGYRSGMAALGAWILCAEATGQGFNVDLNAPFVPPEGGGGVPSNQYGAAAGQSGVWNSVYVAGGQPQYLLNLDGTVSSVLLTGPLGGGGGGNNIPGLTGDFRALMADATGVNPSKTYTISGLMNGAYKVVVYAAPITGFTFTTFVSVSGSISPNPVAVTGPMLQNVFLENVTHSTHTSIVTSGELTIRADMGTQPTYLNGFQIVAVPEPATVALLGVGSFLLLRRRK